MFHTYLTKTDMSNKEIREVEDETFRFVYHLLVDNGLWDELANFLFEHWGVDLNDIGGDDGDE